jgi:NADH-quinone oxidoreductase subunit A
MLGLSVITILLWPFAVYGIFVVSLVSGILLVSYFLGERHKENATNEAYEGGVISTGTARVLFPIHFYIVALFFVIFDMQAVFIIAWAISVKATGWVGYSAILIFIGVFISVLIYVKSIGALDFGTDGRKILKAYYKKIKNSDQHEVVDK